MTSNVVITFAIGEGFAAAIVGYLMNLIHPSMLYIFIFFFSILMFYLVKRTIEKLEVLGKQNELLLEHRELENMEKREN